MYLHRFSYYDAKKNYLKIENFSPLIFNILQHPSRAGSFRRKKGLLLNFFNQKFGITKNRV